MYPQTAFFNFCMLFSSVNMEGWKSQGFKFVFSSFFFSSIDPALTEKIRFYREKKQNSKLMIQHKTDFF